MDLSRRDVLKFGAFGLGAAALLPNALASAGSAKPRFMLVGVKSGVSIHKEPDESSLILYQRQYRTSSTSTRRSPVPPDPLEPDWYRCCVVLSSADF